MKASELLIQRSINGELFDPAPSDTDEDRALLGELRRLCCRELTTSDAVKQMSIELKELTRARTVSRILQWTFYWLTRRQFRWKTSAQT
jgi:hypothetical protein